MERILNPDGPAKIGPCKFTAGTISKPLMEDCFNAVLPKQHAMAANG
jgi:hypothetical protein